MDPLSASLNDLETDDELDASESYNPLSSSIIDHVLEDPRAITPITHLSVLDPSTSSNYSEDISSHFPENPVFDSSNVVAGSTDGVDADEQSDSEATADLLSHNPHFPRKLKACCSFDRILTTLSPSIFNPPLNSSTIPDQPKPAILIEETQITSDLGSSSYVAYIIRVDIPEHSIHLESRHRYSDFETFNRLLRRMHPTILVPPIPEKHNITDLAVGSLSVMSTSSAAAASSKSKHDPKLIEFRKRGLQSFLNRVAAHPILGREHVFHAFLDPQGSSWAEVLSVSGQAHFLKVKDVKKTATGSYKITDSLLKNPDPHFLASEEYTYKFGQQLALLTKYHKRMIRHLSDSAIASADLGATYNGWSLTEQGPSSVLSPHIEALGEAIDCTVTSTHKLVHALEQYVTEPLRQYEKLTAAIETTLKWRHALHVEYEAATEGLVANRATLAKMEATETEAARIAARVKAEINDVSGLSGLHQQEHEQPTSHYGSIVGASSSASSAPQDESDPYAETRRALANYNSSSTVTGGGNSLIGASSTTPTPTNNKSVFPPTSSIYFTLSTFNNLITSDKDPESTRHSTMQRTRDKIRSLESERIGHLSKLGAANEAIQRDLDRFQRDKICDFRNMLLMYAVANRDHSRRCLGAWKEAAEVVGAGDNDGGESSTNALEEVADEAAW
ncbi:Sorting nexin, cytoplasm-to-vacuole targeting pathway/endosomal sorting [Chytriomyces hyalinus]|nr:Sorting nexin, cytoplasm-to-vacuole targeting pathway/endosomal sorting [Chytriomyces hyalinus]